MRRQTGAQLGLLGTGIAGWAAGVHALRPSAIGPYGILAAADPWFLLGLGAIALGFLLELARARPRGWLMVLQLAALIVVIHTTVPLIYDTPEYAWVYKHIGISAAFAKFGQITDPSSIYQEWPVLFAGVAALAGLGHLGPLSFAAWAPVAFELADAVLLLAAFRLLVADRRIGYLAVALYEGMISWVGQDYLSPQAFGYLLWLAIVVVILRWLRSVPAAGRGRLGSVRSALLAGVPAPRKTAPALRAIAVTLVTLMFVTIVAAHQLTPYLALAAVAVLAVLGLIRPWWLFPALAAVAGAYLALHYSLIARQFGGLFSGGNPVTNAAGVRGAWHPGAEATTSLIVRALAAAMWLGALVAVVRSRRQPGRIATTVVLAFTPFAILVAQRYGGEAIYRVFMFSAPWCALLIAEMVVQMRVAPARWPIAAATCALVLAAGLQGLYGPVAVRAFTVAELNASNWMYSHLPRGSLVVLPANDFPALQTADYRKLNVQPMPSDPQVGQSWLDEANLAGVEQWIQKLGYGSAYVVTSRSMGNYARYFGWPRNYAGLLQTIRSTSGWSTVYRDADVSIYRLKIS